MDGDRVGGEGRVSFSPLSLCLVRCFLDGLLVWGLWCVAHRGCVRGLSEEGGADKVGDIGSWHGERSCGWIFSGGILRGGEDRCGKG